MRSISRSLGLASGAMALTALTALAGSGAADAAPTGAETLYAPSALVVSVASGEDPAQATVMRAGTLVCAPRPTGTHPDPAAACAELRATGGAPDALTAPRANVRCTREWNPLTVTVDGVWQGRRMNYAHVFANPCELRSSEGVLFHV
ncbi:SSI family serine proteinase inhibitor [Streptomyces sp. NPDC054838]